MKKIKAILYFLLVLLLSLAVGMAMAQTPNEQAFDKLVFLNGDVKEGKITALTTDKIKFTHCNEILDYEFNKKDIEKIEFASGRTESISGKRLLKPGKLINAKNRVAVLPMQYVADGTTERISYMRTYLQETAINYLSRSAAELQIVDAAEVNVILSGNDISGANISRYTAKELAELLQVDYIVMGAVMQDRGKLLTVVNNNRYGKETIKRNTNEIKIKTNSSNVGTSSTTQEIETQVTLAIYNNSGSKIYDNSRHSLLSDAGAYRNTIKYILKRTPLYKR